MESSDAAIFALMGAIVGLMSLGLVALLVWSLIERPADALVRVATRLRPRF
jgi:HAMP domain-containing protein